MSSALFSPSWYRMLNLHPRLRAHTQIHRHIYRGELWYLIQDHFSGRFHRFSPKAYTVIGLMDGKKNLDEIWQSACERLGDEMPSQDEMIQLLGQLHKADVIQTELPPDMAEIERRRKKIRHNKIMAMIKSPLSIRIPLWDPERFLQFTHSISFVLFSRYGVLLFLLVTISAAMLAGIHWEPLTKNVADRVLGVENLVLLWLVYPLVKAVHEFGHAYAVKRWGGEVHEMGIMFLVFVPVPYVDASAAYAFSNKYQRMLVGAAGILTEVFIAALAMHVWAEAEPGVIRAVAFNVMLIAGVSTVLFNGNPLLRFDAYYVLADFLEIPNFASRANSQLAYLLKKYLLNEKKQEVPAYSISEGIWLILYSITSFVYRMIIMFSIALFVAGKMFIIGTLLAMWSVYGFLIQPTINTARNILTDEQMKKKHSRIFLLIGTFILLTGTLLFVIPVPRNTLSEGVLWVPEQSRVITSKQAMVVNVLHKGGEYITAGTPLISTKNTELSSQYEIISAKIQELKARKLIAQSGNKTTESHILSKEIERTQDLQTRLAGEVESLLIRSPVDGVFHLLNSENLKGRFLQRGESIGYVLQKGTYMARIVLDQADIDVVRNDLKRLQVRLAENMDQVFPAEIVREVPTASRKLPSLALSVKGGGQHALDPASLDEPMAFEPFFQFEIRLEDMPASRIGERIYVLFTHTPEPIGFRWLRAIRRVLLEKLDF